MARRAGRKLFPTNHHSPPVILSDILTHHPIQIITGIGILPLHANGSIPTIRLAAQNLANFPPTVSRLIGPLILWTVTAISKRREELYGDDENQTKAAMRDALAAQANDLLVFAGLIKLRLSKGVWDGIVGSAAEVGAY